MINIELRLFATLRKYLPENFENYQVENNTSVENLLRTIGVDKSEAKIIFINGIKKKMTDQIKDGDRVGIFPPVGGG